MSDGVTAAAVVEDAALRRVLIVDDDPASLRLVSLILRRSGVVVTTAASGPEALEMLEKNTFDCLVSDVMMPHMTGLELVARVRKIDVDLPIILMTADTRVETVVEAVGLGASRYLCKPLDRKALLDAVNQAVTAGGLARHRRAVLVVAEEQAQVVRDDAELATHFDRALGKLWMAFQPIVNVESQSTFAYEALLRSNEPTLPHPGAMLDAAERLGRMRELSRVLQDAAATSYVAGNQSPLLFVNLHASDLADDRLLDPEVPLTRIAARVVLEITERASLSGVSGVRSRLQSLRNRGFRVALDDLGAGYAGFNSLAVLDPDVVKIDMSLIRHLDCEPVKQRLVKTAISLCASLGHLVVGEGVETHAEYACLRDLGCALQQGYYFARPAPTFPEIPWKGLVSAPSPALKELPSSP